MENHAQLRQFLSEIDDLDKPDFKLDEQLMRLIGYECIETNDAGPVR